MTVAIVLSGGANLGSAQLGMMQAAAEAGIRPDFVVGTSVGAVNGAWLAGGRPLDELAEVWCAMRRSVVFPTNPLRGFLGFTGRRNHFVGDRGLRELLEKHLTFDRLENAVIPFHVVATDVLTCADVCLSSGPTVESVLASAAIPGVFPPVELGGRTLMDGGVVNNTPISHAVAMGADTVWVLTTGYSCALAARPDSALGMALHALSLVIHHRLALDIERYADVVDLRVIPPLCPIEVPPTDFSQGATLIERARAHARDWLAETDAGQLVHADGETVFGHEH